MWRIGLLIGIWISWLETLKRKFIEMSRDRALTVKEYD